MPLPNTLGLFVQIRSKHKDFTHKMPDTKSGIKHLSNLAQMQQNICTSIQGFYKKQFKSNMKVSESGGECVERNSQQAISHCYFVTVVWVIIPKIWQQSIDQTFRVYSLFQPTLFDNILLSLLLFTFQVETTLIYKFVTVQAAAGSGHDCLDRGSLGLCLIFGAW